MIRRTREQWLSLFAQHASSGLSAQQFCKNEDVCPRYFSLRRKQLKWKAKASSTLPIAPAAPSAFVRVQKATSPKHQSGDSRVTLRHGRSEIDLHAVSPEWLAQLLAALA